MEILLIKPLVNGKKQMALITVLVGEVMTNITIPIISKKDADFFINIQETGIYPKIKHLSINKQPIITFISNEGESTIRCKRS
jgi:hypothetical protein